MRYTVVWTPAAEQELAAIWLNSTDRNAAASAAGRIDALLAVDPESRGELRFDTVRYLSVPPLGVDFEVIDDDCIVYVLAAFTVTNDNLTA
ncbi:MAG: type II toxin-antitoxin system RelE/ParE family toxin [Planctomycetia bacterium]|nr:type II toxin-antitoxin system RelE/ParE family toxin [Planctomycetia bacterium]